MTAIFADTFYWVALANPEDTADPLAAGFDQARGTRPILTTEEVLTEFLVYFAGRGSLLRKKAVLIVRSIASDPTISVLQQSHATFQAGFELYAARPDKSYSLTDCISMATMRRERMDEALTNDRHFEQEDFRVAFRAS